ncbi:MAG: hypothetical protein LIO58_08840 [Oscillospiraceae bacterium]|nr:hypothetical protein [Oscillospiraceae bacterium]
MSNQDFDWDGATAVRIFSIGTAPMNDYDRNGTGCHWSRYGEVQDLDGTTQLMPLKKDRSFTFAIDRLDENETLQSLAATSALARQLRQVTIPEVDSYTYSVMAGRGASVVRVPTVRLPDGCGFMMCHPSATVAPTKLESFKIHSAPPRRKGR